MGAFSTVLYSNFRACNRLAIFRSSTGAMDPACMTIAGIDSSDDEAEAHHTLDVEVPDCEGIPRRRWNTHCVALFNDAGLHVGDGTCHSVSSDLVLGANWRHSRCCSHSPESL